MRDRLAIRLLTILILWSLGTAWNVGAFHRREEILRRYQAALVVLPRPELVRRASLGFRSVLADFYWIGALNYFGDQRNARVSFKELPNYLELVFALDPDFHYAYLFGGVSLPWNRGHGWENVDEAISVLQRGIDKYPDDWQLRFQLAYTYSVLRKRYKDAGDELVAAAKIPGSPPYCGPLAARMYAATGDFDGALVITQELLRTVDDPNVREAIERRAAEVQVEKDITLLETAVAQFKAAKGKLPTGLDELVRERFLNEIPDEPLGGYFIYRPKNGAVESSVLRDRLRVFEQ